MSNWQLSPIMAELITGNEHGPMVAAKLASDGTLGVINEFDLALLITFAEPDSMIDLDQIIRMGGWDDDDRFNDFAYKHGAYDD